MDAVFDSPEDVPEEVSERTRLHAYMVVNSIECTFELREVQQAYEHFRATSYRTARCPTVTQRQCWRCLVLILLRSILLYPQIRTNKRYAGASGWTVKVSDVCTTDMPVM